MTYEYSSEEIGTDSITSDLNYYADLGWEIVSLCPSISVPTRYVVVIRRPKG